MKDDEKYAAMLMMAQRMDEDKVKEFMDMFTPSERLKFEEVLNITGRHNKDKNVKPGKASLEKRK
jgi:hypothetical protein